METFNDMNDKTPCKSHFYSQRIEDDDEDPKKPAVTDNLLKINHL